jgi:biotin carboxylase
MAANPLLLIGAGQQGLGYLVAAGDLGIPVRLVEFPALVDRSLPLAERVIAAPTLLEESWYAGALGVLDGARPCGVVAFSEPQVVPAALLQEALDLPGPGLHAAVVSRNKALQRALFASGDIPQPMFRLGAKLSDLAEWVTTNLPVVIKPVDGSGSSGVEHIADPRAWAAAVEQRGGDGPFLAEQAVDGPEFSAECLVHEGELLFTNLTAKETTGPPHFIEVCHRAGHRFADPAMREAVADFVAAAVRRLRMRTGIVHLEFRCPASGPMLIEVAVRTPGDFIMEAISLTWQFDLFEAVIALAVNRAPRVPAPDAVPARAAASRFLLATPGKVSAVSGQPEVSAHPAVVRCVVKYQPGDQAPVVRSSPERAGHVLIDAADPGQREAALELVSARLRIVTEPA